MVIGWRVSTSLRPIKCTGAPDQALAAQDVGDGLILHSDRGSQYVPIRYTQRLAEAGIARSVGSVGDAYDNALVESVNSLYKVELVRGRGPWRGIDDVERASTASTTAGCSCRLATFRRRNSSRPTSVCKTVPSCRRHSTKRVNATPEKLGAVQFERDRAFCIGSQPG